MDFFTRLLGLASPKKASPTSDPGPNPRGDSTSSARLKIQVHLGVPSPSQVQRARVKSDWKTSRAHQLLLTKLTSATDPESWSHSDAWAQVLGESPIDAAAHFTQEGLVEPAGLKSILEMNNSQIQLKAKLKERGLKVSGKKEELAARLAGVDPEGIKVLIGQRTFLTCTAKGQELAERFRAEFMAERTAAENTSLELFKIGQLEEACGAMLAFEAKQVFPRGLGINWHCYNGSHEKAVLKHIATARPGILIGLGESFLQVLRPATAMMFLYGQRSVAPWITIKPPAGFRLDIETSARMLMFYAQNLVRLDELRRASVKRVRVLAAPNSCGYCKTFEGQIFPIDRVPELPHPKCAHVMGCRCEPLADL